MRSIDRVNNQHSFVLLLQKPTYAHWIPRPVIALHNNAIPLRKQLPARMERNLAHHFLLFQVQVRMEIHTTEKPGSRTIKRKKSFFNCFNLPVKWVIHFGLCRGRDYWVVCRPWDSIVSEGCAERVERPLPDLKTLTVVQLWLSLFSATTSFHLLELLRGPLKKKTKEKLIVSGKCLFETISINSSCLHFRFDWNCQLSLAIVNVFLPGGRSLNGYLIIQLITRRGASKKPLPAGY